MRFQTKQIVSAQNVAANITSEVINLELSFGFAVQCTFTGSPTGTVLIQGSNDGVNWSLIATLTVASLAVLFTNQDAIYWPFVRAFKAAGGTGTMTTTITTKGG